MLVAGTRFMEILDATVLAVALPAIGRSFDVPAVDVALAITAYLLAVTVLMPLGGVLARRYGVRRIFLLAIIGFTLASGLCAAATSLAVLIVARVAQGACGALMVPVGRIAVLDRSPKESMLRVVAYLTWPALVAPVIGPTIGGLLVSAGSWRWIFLVNLPVGFIAFVVAWQLVPQTVGDEKDRAAPLDLIGLALAGSALATLVVACERAGHGYLEQAALLSVGTVVSTTTLVAHLRRSAAPLFDLRVFEIGTFRVANVTGTAYRVVMETVPFLLPLTFQEGWHWTPAHAGLMVMNLFAGNMLVKPATGPLLRLCGFRWVAVGSTVAGGAGFIVLALLGPEVPWALTAGVLFISGAARSVGYTVYVTLSFIDVHGPDLWSANTLSATLQQLGATLGVVTGALLLQVGGTLGGLDGLGPYRFAFVVLAIAAVALLPGTLRMPATAGAVTRPVRALPNVELRTDA